MKKILLISALITTILVSGCAYDETADTPPSLSDQLKVLKWGPEDTQAGKIINKQPSGKMGIWIETTSTEGIDDVQVLFNGKPVETAVGPKSISAGIILEEISVAGDKKVEIQSIETGESIPVGTFKVTP